jgi:hypothetical protein
MTPPNHSADCIACYLHHNTDNRRLSRVPGTPESAREETRSFVTDPVDPAPRGFAYVAFLCGYSVYRDGPRRADAARIRACGDAVCRDGPRRGGATGSRVWLSCVAIRSTAMDPAGRHREVPRVWRCGLRYGPRRGGATGSRACGFLVWRSGLPRWTRPSRHREVPRARRCGLSRWTPPGRRHEVSHVRLSRVAIRPSETNSAGRTPFASARGPTPRRWRPGPAGTWRAARGP